MQAVGVFKAKEGDLAGARQYFKQATEAEPMHAPAWQVSTHVLHPMAGESYIRYIAWQVTHIYYTTWQVTHTYVTSHGR